MAKQFTKVIKTYSTKNKLQLLILKELETIDCFLFMSNEEAITHIAQLYKSALLLYKGNASIPELKKHESHGYVSFYVDDVISIAIYAVKTEVANPTP